jgi:hypothetical protein
MSEYVSTNGDDIPKVAIFDKEKTKGTAQAKSVEQSSQDQSSKLAKKFKVLVATPCYGGQMFVPYTVALLEAFRNLPKYGIDLEVMFLTNESLIPRGRNECVASFLSGDCTHLLFVDSDVGFNWRDIMKLIHDDKGVIGGIYPKKGIGWEKLNDYKAVIEEYERLWSKTMTFGEFCINKTGQYNLNLLTNNFRVENNVVKIKHLPTGFMMIQRGVLEKLIATYPDKKYINNEGLAKNKSMYYNLFAIGVDQREGIYKGLYQSEDWYFCDLCSETGIEIYANIGVKLTHTGTYKFNGDFMHTLKKST